MKRPRVIVNCVADTYHLPQEKIIEFTFPDGSGGLMSLIVDNYGKPVISLYNVDEAIDIRTDKRMDLA